MPATKYTYDVTNDTLNGKVNLVDIENEVHTSSIVTAFDRRESTGGTINGDVLTGGSLDLWFKDALSTGDQTTLSGIISAHQGNPTPEVTQVEITNTPFEEKQAYDRELDRLKQRDDPNYKGAFHEKKERKKANLFTEKAKEEKKRGNKNSKAKV